MQVKKFEHKNAQIVVFDEMMLHEIDSALARYVENKSIIESTLRKEFDSLSKIATITNPFYIGTKTIPSIRQKMLTGVPLPQINDLIRTEFKVIWDNRVTEFVKSKNGKYVSKNHYKYILLINDIPVEIQIISSTVIRYHQLYDMEKLKYGKDKSFVRQLINKIKNKPDPILSDFKNEIENCLIKNSDLGDLISMIKFCWDHKLLYKNRTSISICMDLLIRLNTVKLISQNFEQLRSLYYRSTPSRLHNLFPTDTILSSKHAIISEDDIEILLRRSISLKVKTQGWLAHPTVIEDKKSPQNHIQASCFPDLLTIRPLMDGHKRILQSLHLNLFNFIKG